ncbi:MAG: hypothetical protein RL662_801 [Bacteroidota bacterium]|jgi:predicted transcriptional regulator
MSIRISKTDMQLTKAEEQIMHILWRLQNILENKDFVQHTIDGAINIYTHIVPKDTYPKKQLINFVKKQH